jgi:hypothetical protein
MFKLKLRISKAQDAFSTIQNLLNLYNLIENKEQIFSSHIK